MAGVGWPVGNQILLFSLGLDSGGLRISNEIFGNLSMVTIPMKRAEIFLAMNVSQHCPAPTRH